MRRTLGLAAALLSAALVAPTAASATPVTSAADARRAGTTAAAFTARPSGATLRPRYRSDWGAAAPAATAPRIHPSGVVIHHTEGTNDYTRAQVPGIIREIQRFHVQERGWDDIGYQLLVDRFGRVWEGRPGGLTRPVDGAHVEGLNSHYLGIAYLGDTSSAPITEAAVRTIVDVTGWAAARYDFSPLGEVRIDGVVRPVMAGHRKYNETLCPGRSLALRMPEIRRRAAVRAAQWRHLGTPWTYAKL